MEKLSSVFEVQYGHSLELNRLVETTRDVGVGFVSRQMGGNGISAWVEALPGVEPGAPGELTCALSGNGVLTTHLQERPFYTAFHVARLRPLAELTKPELLFYCMAITANRYRYSYGRQANRSLKDLDLPSRSEIPSYVHETNLERFEGESAAASVEKPKVSNVGKWAEFRIDDLFILKKGKRLTRTAIKPGDTAFISAIDNNNGLRQRISAKPMHPAGVLTVNYNGNGVAEAFYQPEPFFASDDVNVLYPKAEMDVAMALFLCTIIRQEKFRFSYGRKWNLERMTQSYIKLPVTHTGELDSAYMRSLISSLPYSGAALELAREASSKRQRITVS